MNGIGAGDGTGPAEGVGNGAVMVMSASEVAGTLEVDVGGGRAALGWRLRAEEEMRVRRRDCLVPFCDQPWPAKRPRFVDLGLGLGAGEIVEDGSLSSEDLRSMHSASEMV